MFQAIRPDGSTWNSAHLRGADFSLPLWAVDCIGSAGRIHSSRSCDGDIQQYCLRCLQPIH
jgi:hypothetical protein